jgi:hypothetical protein
MALRLQRSQAMLLIASLLSFPRTTRCRFSFGNSRATLSKFKRPNLVELSNLVQAGCWYIIESILATQWRQLNFVRPMSSYIKLSKNLY